MVLLRRILGERGFKFFIPRRRVGNEDILACVPSDASTPQLTAAIIRPMRRLVYYRDMEEKNIRQTLAERGAQFSGEVRERAVGYITAAFGLVAGLAWNDAIRALIDALFPLAEQSVLAKFVYASVLTVVVVIVTVHLLKRFSGAK